jgi:hypothetical protein
VIRVLIVLFWLSLLIGTLLAHNLVANWAVTLAGLFFLARWWHYRSRERRAAKVAEPATRANPGQGASQSPSAGPPPITAQPRSRWTVDRVHTAEQRWR